MARPSLPPERRLSETLVVRIDTGLLERLDRYVEELARRSPWSQPSRADGARALMLQALAMFEQAPAGYVAVVPESPVDKPLARRQGAAEPRRAGRVRTTASTKKAPAKQSKK